MTISLRPALLLASVAGVCIACAGPAAAQTLDAPNFERVLEIGFQGGYKLGKWTELKLSLVGGKSPCTGVVRVETPDGAGVPSATSAAQPIRLAPGQKSKVVVPVCIGGPDAPLHVVFDYKTDDGASASTAADFGYDDRSVSLPVPIENPAPLVLHLGPSTGVKESITGQKWNEESRPEVLVVETVESLPQRWYGYDAVDLIVLSPAAPALYDALSDAQRQALLEWVRRGGRVLASGGAAAPQLFAPGRPLAEFAPGRFDKLYQLTSSRGFEDFTESTQRLFPHATERLDVATFVGHAGKVIVSEKGAVPLVSRRAMEFGEVVFVSADLNNRLFLEWPGLSAFYNRLLGWQPLVQANTPNQAPNQAYMQQHITDLATDLRIALERFAVWPPPFYLVVVMVIGYVLLIGPGDYFLLRRLGRMELTWVTFPTIVLLVSVAAYWTARSSRGDKLKVNQVNVVDFDLTAKTSRGLNVSDIYAPFSSTYQLSLKPAIPRDPKSTVEPPAADVLLTWFGLPEERAFGGMGNRNSRPILGSTPYLTRPDAGTIADVPILTASTKAFVTRWKQGADVFDAKITLKTDRNGDMLGDLTFTNRLDVKLGDCVLYLGRDSFDLEPIEPGGTWSGPLTSLNRQSLADRLTDMRQVLDVGRNTNVYQSRPYEAASGQEVDVLNAMMFYTAIEGANYTRLSNQYLKELDLSHQLDCGRAMIFAVAPSSAAVLSDAGRPLADISDVRDYTVYRFLVDVTKE